MTAAHEDNGGRAPRALRRVLWGYNRADVEEALEERARQVARLAESVDRLWRDREEQRRTVAESLAAAERIVSNERSIVAQAEAAGRASAARIVAAAEEEAMRVRQTIGAAIADATSRLNDLLRLRESLLDELRTVLTDHDHLLGALESRSAAPATTPSRRPTMSAVPQLPDADVARMFSRRVELRAGPFDDFSELSTFERSLAELPTVEDVYIRAFSSGRAVIELALAEERPLLRDLAVHVPYEILVAKADGDVLTLDLRGRIAVAG